MGDGIDDWGEKTNTRIDCSRICTTTAVATRRTSPHQLPSISHPSKRHALMINTKLTTGTSMPMDLRASRVHIDQRASTVDQMVARPRTARSATSPTVKGA
jgi:hypothetical protein